MELRRGMLVLSKKGSPGIEMDGNHLNPARSELSQSILDRLKQLNGTEVEFEFVNGQPKQVREVGKKYFPPAKSEAVHKYDPLKTRGGNKMTTNSQNEGNRRGDFHNPYNFIPAPPRKIDDPDLGDKSPVDQDQFHTDRITGRIQVSMEAMTPLLVPDSDPDHWDENNDKHKTFNLLKGNDGKPLIPSSGIRGMLRSAYEAVTNSRFGRFPKQDHDNRLAYRMKPTDGLQLIPARIGNGEIHLLTGTSSIKQDGSPKGPQYAAWLPRYGGNNKSTDTDYTIRYSDGSLPEHGDEVVCEVDLNRHRSNRFEYWKVVKIERFRQDNSGYMGKAINGKQKIIGWVCITNANIKNKHDERVFFSDLPGCEKRRSYPLTDSHRNKWRELIENYQAIHEDELIKRNEKNESFDRYYSGEPGCTAWSRHIYTKSEEKLQDGKLCYVRLTKGQDDVEALFPVMIARDLYQYSRWALLDASLFPASKLTELSPADRVFGWVQNDSGISKDDDKKTSVRGLLRVGPVTCESAVAEAIEEFPYDGVPLAILATPKPQQGRFYVAKTPNGEAQDRGLSKIQAGYSSCKGLRGRKIYPHHKDLPAGYWANPMDDRTQQEHGPWQEYRRPDGPKIRSDQNRSVREWVKPGCRFEFDIYVTNLSKAELGALLYILNLPYHHYHRFGGGKPLGFGSVLLKAVDYEFFTGSELLLRYSSWAVERKPDTISQIAMEAFKASIQSAYARPSEEFEKISFIKAFLRGCQGFDDDLPIHYPRVSNNGRPCPPHPEGESFKWFVANEKQGVGFTLPDLADDKGLPMLVSPDLQNRR